VLLAGDAAHLTPPFAGQGMNSGVRDAANLAWKLAAVAQGRANKALLDTYQVERNRHARALIDMALRIGWYMQPKSRLGAAASQTLLRAVCLVPAARDYILNLKFKPKPRFHEGLFATAAAECLIAPGQLMTQPRVQLSRGEQELLDNVLAPGFTMLRLSGSGVAAPAFVERVVDVARQGEAMPAANSGSEVVSDVDGELARVLDSARAEAVILRPDRYVLAYLRRDDPASARAAENLLQPYFT
jgi:3-(3-hydroxy-phenyl)propionate hydroxylase